jgi:hypothetical protein
MPQGYSNANTFEFRTLILGLRDVKSPGKELQEVLEALEKSELPCRRGLVGRYVLKPS